MRRPSALAALAALVTLSLVAAGCGSGGSPGVASLSPSTVPHANGSAPSANALLLAGRCLRRHGIPNLPDPTIATSGPAKGHAILDKRALVAVPSSVVASSMAACRSALAQVGIGPNGDAKTPQEIRDGLAFARCMRHHAITNFPDPNGRGNFDTAGTGINPHALTPAQLAAARTCLPAARGTLHIPQQGTPAQSSGG